jgi:hypothetical protein
MNMIANKAQEKGRDYATPEDVQELIDAGADIAMLRLDALEILSNGGGVGIEDSDGFAFIAWQGRRSDVQ